MLETDARPCERGCAAHRPAALMHVQRASPGINALSNVRPASMGSGAKHRAPEHYVQKGPKCSEALIPHGGPSAHPVYGESAKQ